MNMYLYYCFVMGSGGWVMSKKKTFRLEKNVGNYGRPLSKSSVILFWALPFEKSVTISSQMQLPPIPVRNVKCKGMHIC